MFGMFNKDEEPKFNNFGTGMMGMGVGGMPPYNQPKDYTKSNYFDALFAYLLKIFICCSFAVLFFGEYISTWLDSVTPDKAEILVLAFKAVAYILILGFLRSEIVAIKDSKYSMGRWGIRSKKLWNTLEILIGMIFGFYFVYKDKIDTMLSTLNFSVVSFFKDLLTMVIATVVGYIVLCVLGVVLQCIYKNAQKSHKEKEMDTNIFPTDGRGTAPSFMSGFNTGLAFSGSPKVEDAEWGWSPDSTVVSMEEVKEADEKEDIELKKVIEKEEVEVKENSIEMNTVNIVSKPFKDTNRFVIEQTDDLFSKYGFDCNTKDFNGVAYTLSPYKIIVYKDGICYDKFDVALDMKEEMLIVPLDIAVYILSAEKYDFVVQKWGITYSALDVNSAKLFVKTAKFD